MLYSTALADVATYTIPYSQYNHLPHSRACGIHTHQHGDDCSNDCPTCYGQDEFADTDWFKKSQKKPS